MEVPVVPARLPAGAGGAKRQAATAVDELTDAKTMDDEIHEHEVLNMQETVTCARVATVYLGRAAEKAATAAGNLADTLRPWTDDLMEPLN